MPILNGITNLVKLGEMAVKTEPADGRTVHIEALHLCAAARRPDRRVPQALWRGHLSDGESPMSFPCHRERSEAISNQERNPMGIASRRSQ